RGGLSPGLSKPPQTGNARLLAVLSHLLRIGSGQIAKVLGAGNDRRTAGITGEFHAQARDDGAGSAARADRDQRHRMTASLPTGFQVEDRADQLQVTNIDDRRSIVAQSEGLLRRVAEFSAFASTLIMQIIDDHMNYSAFSCSSG